MPAGFGGACSCKLEPSALGLTGSGPGKVEWSPSERKADVLGLCPKVPSVMRRGDPSAAEDSSGHPNQPEWPGELGLPVVP